MLLPRSLALLCSIVTVTFPSSRAGNPLNVSIPDQPPASAVNVVDDNFVGISWELSSFDTLWGKSVQTIPHAMENYLHNLAVRMTKPLRIRVGGNSMDISTYIPSKRDTMLVLTDPDAYFNNIPVDFGPVLFDVMNAMSDVVGPMQFLIGLSMKHPDDLSNVITLATDATKMLGTRLDGMLLGNEPDLYPGYSVPTYVTDVGDTLGQLQDNDLLSEPIMGGPTICCAWNLSTILDAGLDNDNYKYYTVQRYPQQICGGPDAQNTNISYYLSHMNVGPFLNWQQEGMARAQAAGVPVLLTEYNTVACGGSNISNTFGASLWAIDVALKSSTVNYTAVYLHTREYNVTYNLFDPPTPQTSTNPGWKTGSTYYAALFLSEVGSPKGSIIVDLNLNNSNTSPTAKVGAYAIYDGERKVADKLALINFQNQNQNQNQESQVFRLPSGIAASDTVQIRILRAPDVLETKNISWAGQVVGDNGDLLGEQLTVLLDCKKGCEVEVPGPGAALVLLGSTSTFFSGNSTIEGIKASSSYGVGYGGSWVWGIVWMVVLMVWLA